MTPDTLKRPLPSSTSMLFPDQPETIRQWQLALQRVKLLYVRGQWKECAAWCSQVLSGAKSEVSITVASIFKIPLNIAATTIARNLYKFLSRSFQRDYCSLDPRSIKQQASHTQRSQRCLRSCSCVTPGSRHDLRYRRRRS